MLGLTAYRHIHKSGGVPTIAYWMSSYGLVIYAVACTVFVGYITNTSAGQSFVGVTAAVLGSIAPSILLICLVQSIAPSFRASDDDHP
jgi:biotin transporter BioY